MSEGGWILLGERPGPGEEIALGLAGKFWRPVIEFAPIETAEEFRGFEEPGFAKTVYALSTRELQPGRTLLAGLMRTATTDEHARGTSTWDERANETPAHRLTSQQPHT